MFWSATRETLLIGINIYTHGAKDNFSLKFLSFLIQTVTEIVFPPKYKVRTKNILVSILVIVLVIAIEQCKDSHLSHSLIIHSTSSLSVLQVCMQALNIVTYCKVPFLYSWVCSFYRKAIMCVYKFSHDYQDYGLLRYITVHFGTGVQWFHKYLLPSSSSLQDGSSRLEKARTLETNMFHSFSCEYFAVKNSLVYSCDRMLLIQWNGWNGSSVSQIWSILQMYQHITLDLQK
jgi:hypothetical protein